jgi:hypothetical protein
VKWNEVRDLGEKEYAALTKRATQLRKNQNERLKYAARIERMERANVPKHLQATYAKLPNADFEATVYRYEYVPTLIIFWKDVTEQQGRAYIRGLRSEIKNLTNKELITGIRNVRTLEADRQTVYIDGKEYHSAIGDYDISVVDEKDVERELAVKAQEKFQMQHINTCRIKKHYNTLLKAIYFMMLSLYSQTDRTAFCGDIIANVMMINPDWGKQLAKDIGSLDYARTVANAQAKKAARTKEEEEKLQKDLEWLQSEE